MGETGNKERTEKKNLIIHFKINKYNHSKQ